jgi:hypothetical protein
MLEPVTVTVRVCLPVLVCPVFQLVDALVPFDRLLAQDRVPHLKRERVRGANCVADFCADRYGTLDGGTRFRICTAGCTIIASVGGLGSLSPALSTVVNDSVEVPASIVENWRSGTSLQTKRLNNRPTAD